MLLITSKHMKEREVSLNEINKTIQTSVLNRTKWKIGHLAICRTVIYGEKKIQKSDTNIQNKLPNVFMNEYSTCGEWKVFPTIKSSLENVSLGN